ncbi:hypothetical protein [Actinomadura sp. B10D3]|uniref:hypothetical protein n=1 Tax=Actinomadura sp. B10D3 TaxID=3153557 RepID=UPI00325C361A
MDDHDENALHEKPLEFMTSIANSGGHCDGQAVLPHENRTGYYAFCSCGDWRVDVETQEDGLHLARVHTGSVQA